MFRRILTILILVSMTLHCSSRLGVLSYLFENRYEIAYSLGIITEVPIATCSSEYDFTPGLTIHHADEEQSLPQHFSQAQEINLFFNTVNLDLKPKTVVQIVKGFDMRDAGKYSSPSLSVFHPPSIG